MCSRFDDWFRFLVAFCRSLFRPLRGQLTTLPIWTTSNTERSSFIFSLADSCRWRARVTFFVYWFWIECKTKNQNRVRSIKYLLAVLHPYSKCRSDQGTWYNRRTKQICACFPSIPLIRSYRMREVFTNFSRVGNGSRRRQPTHTQLPIIITITPIKAKKL